MKRALLLLALLASAGAATNDARYAAFSLAEAEKRLSNTGPSPELNAMGGITDPIGFVYDPASQDYIVVGFVDHRKQPVSLDVFATALRAVLRYGRYPLVSIDPPPPGTSTRLQPVRFDGGLEDTLLGKRLLDADIVLKRLALGKIKAELWGVRSYLAQSAEYARNAGVLSDVSSLFWLRAGKPDVAGNAREGVLAVQRCRVTVDTQILAESEKDEVGEAFANQLAASFAELAFEYPALAHVAPIQRTVAIAQGMAISQNPSLLDFWTNRHAIVRHPTPRAHELEEASQNVAEMGRSVQLSGGIDTDIALDLEAGDATAFRDVVLQSRPQRGSLTWSPPLQAWDLSGEPELQALASAAPKAPGFHMDRKFLPPTGTTPRPLAAPTARIPVPSAMPAAPAITASNRIAGTRTVAVPALPTAQSAFNPWRALQPNHRLGGVLFNATATVAGDGGPIDMSAGNFSLIVEGADSRLDHTTLRKFITALWSVYYHDQDPGISIDPQEDGIPQHKVRYIGNVAYTDLGRVMREADYLMKKMAVGTEKPRLRDFQDVDARMARLGYTLMGASRRFWFVPEDMQFRKAGNLLVFDSGRMTLKTEIDHPNYRHVASPADNAFADFFTGHYDELARDYPVFKELMEYAKFVSLAKHLKQSGVPMFWYLMAHKHLVIVEDSPDVVDELVKQSDHRRGITIKGGVQLGFKEKYIPGDDVSEAIRLVTSTGPRPPRGGDARATPVRYSIESPHSSTFGRDELGLRYQTDFVVRKDSGPGLELVRYYDPRRSGGEFGNGWRLLVPYRVTPAGTQKRPFRNAIVPERMNLENLLTGEKEELDFNDTRYRFVGYVPRDEKRSQVLGLFITAGGGFRLMDRIGNEFRFDGAGGATELLLGDRVHWKIEYARGMTNRFEESPYELSPAADERVRLRNAVLPKRIEVRDRVNGTTETLTFSAEGQIAGYVPQDDSKSRYKLLAILTNGAFRLLDKHGNESAFRGDGRFEGMIISTAEPLVSALSIDDRRIEMQYTIDNTGRVLVARAEMKGGDAAPTVAVRYAYDESGRLAAATRL